MAICTQLTASNIKEHNKTLHARVFVFLVHDSNNQLQRIIIIKVVARSDRFAPLNAITFIQPRYCNTIINIIIYMPISPAKTHILNRKNEDLSVIHIFHRNAHFPSRHILDPKQHHQHHTTWAEHTHIFGACIFFTYVFDSDTVTYDRGVWWSFCIRSAASSTTMKHHTTKRLPSVPERCTKRFRQQSAQWFAGPKLTRNLVGVYWSLYAQYVNTHKYIRIHIFYTLTSNMFES